MKCSIVLLAILLVYSDFLATFANAESATWRSRPDSGVWYSDNNWTPKTVPNGPDDVATFASSIFSRPFVYSDTEVNSVIFDPGASSFTITTTRLTGGSQGTTLLISGPGVINDSGVTQNFVTGRDSTLIFSNDATPGEQMVFTNAAGDATSLRGGWTIFSDNSSAGNAAFICDGDTNSTAAGALVRFRDQSSAANATFVVNGMTFGGVYDGAAAAITFEDDSTAATGIFTINGGIGEDALGARLQFNGGTAEQATLIANGGTNDGLGGKIFFEGTSRGGKARVALFANGTLDISDYDPPTLTIGSIEGDGGVLLGKKNLTVGSNDANTRFSGVIQGTGSLIKAGSGKLLLDGISSYTGGTVIDNGELQLGNTIGSSTGSGAIKVNAGTLSGAGRIDGAVTIGTGTGIKAVLSPGAIASSQATMKVRNILTFNSDATYQYGLNSDSLSADKVIAHAVTINGGTLKVSDFGTATLTPGTSFTAISNNDVTAINGTFTNLPDGETILVGNNTFQANYEGGDGNDLTLTVVQ